MRKLVILIFLFSLNAGAQNPPANQTQSSIESSKFWQDLDYVGDGITGHRLDIYLPKNGNAPYPVVFCIYGSAFFSNNSKAATFSGGLGQRLLKEGFAVVSINHRSSHDAKFPAQIHDVKAAIRFVRANNQEFSLDSNFIGITGWSSGGHLSALAGTTNTTKKDKIGGLDIDIEGNLGKFTTTSSRINAVVDWYGPTDFLIMDSCGSQMRHNDVKSPESSLIGGAIQENKGKVALANPISYVKKNNPPFLIFHGDRDMLVPHCQSERLYVKLQQEGVKSELVIISGGGHGPGVMIEKYYDKMMAFFKEQVTGTAK
ncbi:MAG TPA: alpha/beta hydrolase [Chitinophagaceae bacterium]|nr:alpha/beta hydrolase [Chitinophagaceae bacterium]